MQYGVSYIRNLLTIFAKFACLQGTTLHQNISKMQIWWKTRSWFRLKWAILICRAIFQFSCYKTIHFFLMRQFPPVHTTLFRDFKALTSMQCQRNWIITSLFAPARTHELNAYIGYARTQSKQLRIDHCSTICGETII